LENNFKSTLVEEDLTFVLQESTQLTSLLFKASFQGRKWESGKWNGQFRYKNNCSKGDDSQAEFSLHAEEPARRPGAEIRAEGGKEAVRNLLLFCMLCSIWRRL
jgi:hypothetical protein